MSIECMHGIEVDIENGKMYRNGNELTDAWLIHELYHKSCTAEWIYYDFVHDENKAWKLACAVYDLMLDADISESQALDEVLNDYDIKNDTLKGVKL